MNIISILSVIQIVFISTAKEGNMICRKMANEGDLMESNSTLIDDEIYIEDDFFPDRNEIIDNLRSDENSVFARRERLISRKMNTIRNATHELISNLEMAQQVFYLQSRNPLLTEDLGKEETQAAILHIQSAFKLFGDSIRKELSTAFLKKLLDGMEIPDEVNRPVVKKEKYSEYEFSHVLSLVDDAALAHLRKRGKGEAVTRWEIAHSVQDNSGVVNVATGEAPDNLLLSLRLVEYIGRLVLLLQLGEDQ